MKRDQELDICSRIEDFESALSQNQDADLAQFLPPSQDPIHDEVLCELIRVEMDWLWSTGQPKSIEHYQARFPALFENPVWVKQVAFEEWRQRRMAGQDAPIQDYLRRFGIEPRDWPGGLAPSDQPWHDQLRSLAKILDKKAQDHELDAQDLSPVEFEATIKQANVAPGCAQVFLDAYQDNPKTVACLVKSLARMPEAGETFLTFELVKQLGQGAIGRVFLAQQKELANRQVALKIAADIHGESQTLAQLRHPNIVPIHSIHRGGPFQAVCMPYLGSTTLADVIRDLKRFDTAPQSGKDLVGPIRSARAHTLASLGLSFQTEADLSKQNSQPPSDLDSTLIPGDSVLPTEIPAVGKNSATPSSSTNSRYPVDSGLHLESSTTSSKSNVASLPNRGDKIAGCWALDLLESLDYMPAVLWIGARLADGLTCAHGKGIIHGDIKPANILMTDEGEPMLLDFNLAVDLKTMSPAEAWVGGTLPYMAPEHLQSLLEHRSFVDVRGDIYSLGVVLYELLTGRRPFPLRHGEPKHIAKTMIDDRLQITPSMRRWNRSITPSVRSIILRCLAPDPKDRYATAQELHEDLTRQLENRPLKHVKETAGDLASKWIKRNRLLAFAATASMVIGMSGAVWQIRTSHVIQTKDSVIANQQAVELARKLRMDLDETLTEGRFLLSSPQATTNLLRDWLSKSEPLLKTFQAPRWAASPGAFGLDPRQKNQLRDDLCELAMLSARTFSRLAGQGSASWDHAFEMNQLAESIHESKPVPSGIIRQRARLCRLAGRLDEAKSLEEEAGQQPPKTFREHYLVVLDQFEDAEFDKAFHFLTNASVQDSANPQAWMLLGNIYVSQSMPQEAIDSYSTALSLNPKCRWLLHHRGNVFLERKEYDKAIEDFTQIVQLYPSRPTGWINRAVALDALKRHQEAIDDLNQAVKLPDCPTRCWFFLAQIKESLGQIAEAQADRQEGLKRQPNDEESWVARSLAQLARTASPTPSDLETALADVQQALKLNPHYVPALHNKASLLSMLRRDKEAILALDQAVLRSPKFAQALIGRGVLRARENMRILAHEDASKAVAIDPQPATLYQAGCVYALTSREVPDDSQQAVNHLSRAFQGDRSWINVAKTDTDLDPIRNQPEFRSLLENAERVSLNID